MKTSENKHTTAHEDDLALFEDENILEGRYLAFWIQKELYGIPIKDVIEIVGIQKITTVPDTPEYVQGVINLRGQVIPVIDVRKRFNIGKTDYNEETCIIVINLDTVDIGMIVDTVDEVYPVPENKIKPPPKITVSDHGEYIHGISKIGAKTLMIVDTEKLFYG
ncbi:MAG: chemotaxis protein CheW [Fibrobacterota bacterium]